MGNSQSFKAYKAFDWRLKHAAREARAEQNKREARDEDRQPKEQVPDWWNRPMP